MQEMKLTELIQIEVDLKAKPSGQAFSHQGPQLWAYKEFSVNH